MESKTKGILNKKIVFDYNSYLELMEYLKQANEAVNKVAKSEGLYKELEKEIKYYKAFLAVNDEKDNEIKYLKKELEEVNTKYNSLKSFISNLLQLLKGIFKKMLSIGTDKEKDLVSEQLKECYDNHLYSENDINDIKNFDVNSEKNMVLMGFIGFLDPPKESAKVAIEKLNNHGIRVIVLTGDNAEVTRCICNKVNINSKKIILGSDIDKLTDQAVIRILRKVNIFAKLSPIQKARIVRLLKEAGNIVGYMGDGINDSPSLINSDVGISVDTAVDIAKESADIILLEKDLNVLLDGVQERKKNICKPYEIYKTCNKL